MSRMKLYCIAASFSCTPCRFTELPYDRLDFLYGELTAYLAMSFTYRWRWSYRLSSFKPTERFRARMNNLRCDHGTVSMHSIDKTLEAWY